MNNVCLPILERSLLTPSMFEFGSIKALKRCMGSIHIIGGKFHKYII